LSLKLKNLAAEPKKLLLKDYASWPTDKFAKKMFCNGRKCYADNAKVHEAASMIIFEGIVGHGHILISVIMPKFAAFLAAHLPSIGSVTVSDV